MIYIYNTNILKYNAYEPKTSGFVSTELKSGLGLSTMVNEVCNLSLIVHEINHILPQLTSFVDQFHNTINEHGVSVITDSTGNMSIDVSNKISDIQAQNISKKIGVLDSLINKHGDRLSDLFKEGMNIEDRLKIKNIGYASSNLGDQLSQYRKLLYNYKHFK
jgi:hypothetical protein